MDKEDQKLSQRLFSLKSKLSNVEKTRPQEREGSTGSSHKSSSGMARGFQLSTEFIAAVAVGFGIGYYFDKSLNTTPWGIIIFLLLGFAAGVLNVMRAAQRMADESKGSQAAKEQDE